jgi:hypothetical protein
MSTIAGSADGVAFDEEALKRGVASVRHPLTRALLALTFTTGLVDAVSYLALGRVFTANMTGNIVLLGFGIAGSGGLPVVAPLVSLGSFVVGAGAGGVLVKRMGPRHPVLVARALAIEVSLLAVATIVAVATTVEPGHAPAYVLIVLMASAMGVRNQLRLPHRTVAAAKPRQHCARLGRASCSPAHPPRAIVDGCGLGNATRRHCPVPRAGTSIRTQAVRRARDWPGRSCGL